VAFSNRKHLPVLASATTETGVKNLLDMLVSPTVANEYRKKGHHRHEAQVLCANITFSLSINVDLCRISKRLL
jgi:hypothetical protein